MWAPLKLYMIPNLNQVLSIVCPEHSVPSPDLPVPLGSISATTIRTSMTLIAEQHIWRRHPPFLLIPFVLLKNLWEHRDIYTLTVRPLYNFEFKREITELRSNILWLHITYMKPARPVSLRNPTT